MQWVPSSSGRDQVNDDKKFNRPNIVSVFEYSGLGKKEAIEKSIQIISNNVRDAIHPICKNDIPEVFRIYLETEIGVSLDCRCVFLVYEQYGFF